MVKLIKKNQLSLISLVLSCLIVLLGLASFQAVALETTPEFEVNTTLKFAHIADTHYYPLRYTHNDMDEGDFYRMMKGDTKILIESNAIFASVVEDIYENGAELDFLVVAGDVTKDAEIGSHLDVANTFRQLQNRIREDYNNPDFQIFVIMGNHDLYNPAAYSYGGDGMRKSVRTVTRKDVSYIYAGLGYPDLSYDDMINDSYLQELLIENGVDASTHLPYQYDTVKNTSFIESFNSSKYDFTYLYEERYSTAVADYLEGDLSYIAISNDANRPFTMMGIDSEHSNAEIGHTASGAIRAHVMDFYSDMVANVVPESHTLLGTTHRNFIPQFSLQAQYLTGFVIEDWVNVTDFFADLGLRYVFTGHMHANAINHHISFNNNQLTDIEVAGASSFKTGIRYLTLDQGTFDGTYAENLYVDQTVIEEVDFSYMIDNNYITLDYLESNNLLQFMDMENKLCLNFSEYFKMRVYEGMVDNYMIRFLNPSTIDELAGMIKDFIPDFLSVVGNLADKLVLNLIDEINNKVLADYQYQGNNPLFTGNEHKVLGYLEELVNTFREIEVSSDGTKIQDFVLYGYYAHVSGLTYQNVSALPLNIQEGIANLQNGSLLKEALDLILNEEIGIYRLLAGLLQEEVDLTKGMTQAQINGINAAIRLFLGLSDFNLNSVVVEEFLGADLSMFGLNLSDLIDIEIGEKGVLDFLNYTIDSYFTESLYKGVGNIIADVVISLSTSAHPNVDYENTLHIKLNADDMFTYIAIPREDNPTIENGKLPSMLTVSFGADPKSDKNFVWFTDKRVTSSEIMYSLNENMSNPTTVTGDTTIYAHYVPQLDFGFFSTYGVSEIGRHSVEVTGLSAGTTYYYKVGSQAFNYWSPVYTMTTAPNTNAPFEALVIADAQGYTQSAYNQVFEVLNNIGNVFENGFDFVLSVGDDVDNSRNINHYKYYLNTNQAFWGNTINVTAPGNHEVYSFEAPEGFIPSNSEVFVGPYNCHLMHYNPAIPSANVSLTGGYYSFDYSGVHFVVLNTNDIDADNKMSQTQVQWLENDLASTNKDHIVVIMHKSLYSAGSHSFDTDVENMREQLTPIFYDNGVNLVLGGHDHTFSYTYYLDGEGNPIKTTENGSTKISNNGTLYVTLSTVGDKLYKWQDNPDVPIFFGKDFHSPTLFNPMFAKLSYDGTSLYFEAYDYDLATGEITPFNANRGYKLDSIIIVASIIIIALIGVVALFIKKKRA